MAMFLAAAAESPRPGRWLDRMPPAGVFVLAIVCMISARLGLLAALRSSRACHVVAAATIGLLVFEQSLVRPGDLSRVKTVFFTVNRLASVTLAGFAGADVPAG